MRVTRTGVGFYLTEYVGICLLGIFSESESIAGVLNWGAGLAIAVLPTGKPPNGKACDGRSGSRWNGLTLLTERSQPDLSDSILNLTNLGTD